MAVDPFDIDLNEFLLVSHRDGVDGIDLRPYLIDTGGSLSHTLEDGWELEVTVADPSGRIRRHPIFGDPDVKLLPAVDVQVDNYWFRLRRLERRDDATLVLTFQERLIDRIARQSKPIVTSRNKATRREFIVARAKTAGAKHWYAPMIHTNRRILTPEEAETHGTRKAAVGGTASGGPQAFRVPANKWGKKYGVDPWVLMGIGWTETRFGANNTTSTAGARGFMQFMPGTRADVLKKSGHDAYGTIDEAVAAAAYYLHASGYKIGNDKAIHDAIWAYNHSEDYIRTVLSKGKEYRGEGTATDGSEPVLVEGDSLGVGMAKELKDQISNKITERTKVGRSTGQGLADLKKLTKTPDTWVILLGTNDIDLAQFKKDADAIMRLAKEKTVFWLNIKRASHVGQAIDTQINDALNDLANKYENLSILDWKGLAENQNINLDSESIHPDAAGYKKMASMIGDALELETQASGSPGTRTIAVSYTFRVGELQEDGERENWWEGIQRLSDEIQIRSFVDRDVFICMSEEELGRSEAVATISEDDDNATMSWVYENGDVLERNITVQVQSTRWAFPPGACVIIDGEGKMDGRYIVTSKDRTLFDQSTTLTLRQPLEELPEPAHDTKSVTDDPADFSDDPSGDSSTDSADTSSADWSGTPAHIINTQALQIGRAHGAHAPQGGELTVANNTAANHLHTHLGSASDHAGPESYKWASDMSIGPDIRGGNNAKGAKIGDAIAKDLAKKFGVNWPGSGLVSATHKGYRVQIIWRYEDPQAGNHYTHVHFGVRKVG